MKKYATHTVIGVKPDGRVLAVHVLAVSEKAASEYVAKRYAPIKKVRARRQRD